MSLLVLPQPPEHLQQLKRSSRFKSKNAPSRALKREDYFMADDMEKNKQQGGQSGQPGQQDNQSSQKGQTGQQSGQPGQQKKGGQNQDQDDNENLDRQRRAS
jgi:hypothetical protein